MSSWVLKAMARHAEEQQQAMAPGQFVLLRVKEEGIEVEYTDLRAGARAKRMVTWLAIDKITPEIATQTIMDATYADFRTLLARHAPASVRGADREQGAEGSPGNAEGQY